MPEQRLTTSILLDLHSNIARAASEAIAGLAQATVPELFYPPGVEFASNERDALANLELTPQAKSALQKVITNAAASVCFNHLALLDGVADPELPQSGVWLGARFAEHDDNRDSDMLHDEFLETYWAWMENRV